MLRIFIAISSGYLIGFLATYISLSGSIIGGHSNTIQRNIRAEDVATATSTPTPTTSQLIKMPSLENKTASPEGEIFGIGQFCGGTQNSPCPPGLICEKEDRGQEASGFCGKNSAINK